MPEKRYILGVDPGSRGAFALLSIAYDPRYIEADDVVTFPFPSSVKSGLNVNAMWNFLQPYKDRIHFCVLEHVHSLGLSAAKATFSFGFNTGIAYALLSLLKNVWRPEHMVYLDAAQTKRDPKAISLNASKDIYPGVSFTPGHCKVPHDGCIDAALIAWYGYLWDRGLTVQPKTRKKSSSRRRKTSR